MCAMSSTKVHPFLILSHTIRDSACPLALYMLEQTVFNELVEEVIKLTADIRKSRTEALMLKSKSIA